MSTPTSELGVIPFPRIQEPSGSDQQHSSVEDSVSDSQGSSSRLTSSDKLTDLPTTRATPIDYSKRTARPSHFGITPAQRGYRRSLDASTSLPSFFERQFHSPPRSAFLRNSDSGNSTPGKETPRQRMPSENDRDSANLHRHSVVQAAISRLSGSRGASEPSMATPAKRPSPLHKSPESDTTRELSSPPRTRSRAVSPLRLFQQWSNGHHRGHRHEEPFVPINPFKRKGRTFRGKPASRPSTLDQESLGSGPYECEDVLPLASVHAFFQELRFAVTDSIPRQIYLNFLLRLPAMYFTRVSRIFEDAEVSRPDIERMIEASCGEYYSLDTRDHAHPSGPHTHHPTAGLSPLRLAEEQPMSRNANGGPGSPVHANTPLPFPDEWTPQSVPPSLFRFKLSWEAFIDSLLREWKTFNIISALLSSAIVSMFQVPEAVEDPITRTAALMSIVCALMSLSYGCMYIVRFGTMRSMARASNWAEDAQKTKTAIWWNVWVLLAMPAVWMAWAMLLFLTAVLSFVWRTGSDADPPPGSRPPAPFTTILGPRIAITAIFALGMAYLFLIVNTLKRYGASRGKAAEDILKAGSAAAEARTSIVGNVGRTLGAVALPLEVKDEGFGQTRSHLGSGDFVDGEKESKRGRERYRSPFIVHGGGGSSTRKRTDTFGVLGLVDMSPLNKINSTASSV